MSFFEDLEPTTTFETSGIQKLIPNDTKLLCAIASANWKESTDFNNKSIDVLLHVIQRGEFQDFLVKDNIKIYDADISKAGKAKVKLLAYDTIGTGLLFKAAKSKNIEDNDLLLNQALAGVELLATFAVWEMPDSKDETKIRSGNWVRKIEPKPKALQAEDAHIERQALSQPNAPTSTAFDDPDDDPDMPF